MRVEHLLCSSEWSQLCSTCLIDVCKVSAEYCTYEMLGNAVKHLKTFNTYFTPIYQAIWSHISCSCYGCFPTLIQKFILGNLQVWLYWWFIIMKWNVYQGSCRLGKRFSSGKNCSKPFQFNISWSGSPFIFIFIVIVFYCFYYFVI